MDDAIKRANDAVLERIQGVPAQTRSQLEAMMDPGSRVQPWEANDNAMSTADERVPAEVFCLAEFLCDEMQERGWKTEDVAVRMKTPSGAAMDLFCLDLVMAVQDDGLILDDELFSGIARAFDVSPEFFRNLHETWKRYPDRRSPFKCPEEIFGPISRRAMIRSV